MMLNSCSTEKKKFVQTVLGEIDRCQYEVYWNLSVYRVYENKKYTYPTTFMCISCSKLNENPSSSQIGDLSERTGLPVMLCVNVVRSVQIKPLEEFGHITFFFVLN